MLMPSEAATDLATAKQLGAQEVQRRSRSYRTNKSLRDRLVNALLGERVAKTPSIHVEEQLYDGFFSNEDQEVLFAFHDADWKDRFELLLQLKDARLQKMGRRILFSEAPDCLPQDLRAAHEREFAARLVAEQSAWLSVPTALEQTDDLLETAKDQSKPFLVEYRAYLGHRLDEAMAQAA